MQLALLRAALPSGSEKAAHSIRAEVVQVMEMDGGFEAWKSTP